MRLGVEGRQGEARDARESDGGIGRGWVVVEKCGGVQSESGSCEKCGPQGLSTGACVE